jgi:uncharacterized protein (UPF0335 family)
MCRLNHSYHLSWLCYVISFPPFTTHVYLLQVFNGSGVSPRERIDSEKNYLRAVLRDVERVKKEDTEIESAAAQSTIAEINAAFGAVTTEAKGVGSDVKVESVSTVSSVSSGLAKLMAEHPRFSELHAKYGADLIPMVSVL